LQDVPVHISLLYDGRLLYWGRDKAPDGWDRKDGCNTYILNLADQSKNKVIPNTTTNLFCSGHSFLPGGRLLVVGGHDRYDEQPQVEGIGERDLNLFDPRTDSWLKFPISMQNGRWYPYNVTLEDGSVMIMSGSYWDGTKTPMGTPHVINNSVPEKLLLTGNGVLRSYPDGGMPALFNYPYLHLTPDGKVLMAGPTVNNSLIFDPDGNGGAGTTTALGAPGFGFLEGTATLYDSANGKVLMTGGRSYTTSYTTRDAMVLDLSTTNQWRPVAQMNFARKYHTSVLLPDGKVLVAGGTQCGQMRNSVNCPDQYPGGGAALSPELWDPGNETPGSDTWRVMAPNPSGIPRVYHSTALLLPDATVLVGGGGLPAAGGEVAGGVRCTGEPSDPLVCKQYGHRDAEIFSPPYLFTPTGQPAPRPVITKVNGGGFPYSTIMGRLPNIIETPNAQEVASVVLIRNPSVTHGFNQDQRRVVLNFTRDGAGRVIATGPASGKEAPPGPYMLFLLNQSGTPSVAKMVEVTYPPVRTNVALAAKGGQANASSTYSGGYPADGAINGDRRGTNWAAGGGWNDGTANQYPDQWWVDFNGPKRIDEVDIFTLQDDYRNPQEPTLDMTFNLFGIVDFDVYYVDGAGQLIALAAVRGNNKVWRQIKFPPVTTTRILVHVLNAKGSYARITEVEAWEAPAATNNVALSANGGQALGSSTYSGGYPASAVINGDNRGLGWAAGTGGWNDATLNSFPDSLEIRFSGEKQINEIDLFTLQDNYNSPLTPTSEMTFTQFGVTAFRVSYWDSSTGQWVTLAEVQNNNKVWRKLEFPAVRTPKILVTVLGGLANYSRVVEVEAWEAPGP
jgi:hypothetical protein